jgi:hypothetical protein
VLALKLFLAFSIATAIALAELVTSQYPRTIGLIWKRSKALWIYAVIYGLISLGFAAAYGPLSRAGVLNFDTFAGAASGATPITPATKPTAQGGHGASNDTPTSNPRLTVLIAIMIGLSTKALLHIRLFSVPASGTQQTFPVGTETIVQIFEPWLLRTILIDEFNAVSTFLDDKAGRYLVLADTQKKIVDNLPASNGFPKAELTALKVDIAGATTPRAAMEIYLRSFGATALSKLFP